MMIPVNAIIEILEKALDFTNNVVRTFDDEKYARAVNEIYGHEPDYSELDALTRIIENATDISTEKKMELIFAITDKKNEIRDREIEHKKACAEVVNKGFEKKGEVVLKLALGIFTGGLSFIPEVYSVISRKSKDDELIIEPRSEEE